MQYRGAGHFDRSLHQEEQLAHRQVAEQNRRTDDLRMPATPEKRHPGQTHAEHDRPEVDPNTPFIEAGSSGGLGWGTTNTGYQPVLVRILRALARRRDRRSQT